jgi:hypothetical protein
VTTLPDYYAEERQAMQRCRSRYAAGLVTGLAVGFAAWVYYEWWW